jgi:hypothetical protein
MTIIPVSAKTQQGMSDWMDYLLSRRTCVQAER